MNEYKKSTNYDSDYTSSSFKLKKRNKKKIEKSSNFLICIKRWINILINKYKIFISKLSLKTQILIFSILFSLALYFSLFFGNYFCYEIIFKFDFYNTIKNQYLNHLINSIENAHLDIDISEIKSQFEDMDNIYFFDIYYKELISMGLLEESSVEIFPKISEKTEKDYLSLDKLNMEFQINNQYTIPQKDSEKFIDNRKEDNLSDLGKIYYYMFPLLAYEAFTKNTYINETYLIAYEIDEDKNILGEEFYFTFPKLKTELSKTNNFMPTNSIISPKISKNQTNFGKKTNDSYFTENWFLKQDYEFRMNSNENYDSKISFFNLNFNYFGKLNRTNIITLQNYLKSNNKHFIVNIIYFINKKDLSDGNFQNSIFLLFNNSMNIVNKEKYSDSKTYLVSKFNIVELSLANKLSEYFFYGMQDKDNNFYNYGVSFDALDLENLGEPLKYYQSNDNFNIDLRYFSTLYLYASLFKNIEYEETDNEFKDINEIVFEKNESLVKNICEEINFSSYISYLLKENVDCWDDQTLLYLSSKSSKEDVSLSEYISKPYCICMPLFCLDNYEESKNQNNFKYREQITLPNECQNHYKAYLNHIDEAFKDHSPDYEPENKVNYWLNNIEIGKNINSILEDEYYIFKKIKFNCFNETIFMLVTCVDNSDLKSLYSLFITNINLFKAYYLLFILIGMFVALFISNIFLYLNIKRISDIIFSYNKIQEQFISQIISNSSNNNKKISNSIDNNNSSTNKLRKIDNNYENSLLKDKNKNIEENIINYINSNGNPILEGLFEIYYKYYNISKLELIKKKNNLNHSNEEKNNFEENELFKILRILSYYIPKFTLEVSMDYNFFINSKLNSCFMKLSKDIKGYNSQLIMLTQSLIFELLSTENIEDCGLITNFYFRYLTNINLRNKNENNSIKNSLFKYSNDKTNFDAELLMENKNNDNILIEENSTSSYFIVHRKDNKEIEEFENNFENDDFLKKEKLISYFNSFIINVYYKYLKKILTLKPFELKVKNNK